jgi:hypothetical protein
MGATTSTGTQAATTAQAAQPSSFMQYSSLLTQAMSTGANAYVQAGAISEQGKFQTQQMETNARMAKMQADQATKRGEKAAQAVRQKTKQLIGSQRAALAAQGIEVNADTAADIQADTSALGALDALTVKNNAWLEAWGYKVQANDYETQAKMVSNAAKYNSKMTLVTGGIGMARDVLGGMSQAKNGTRVSTGKG